MESNDINQMLNELGTLLSIIAPFEAPQGEEAWQITLSDGKGGHALTFHMFHDRPNCKLVLDAILGAPNAKNEAATYAKAQQFGFLWEQTGSARISLDDADRLHLLCDIATPELSSTYLGQRIRGFAQYAIQFQILMSTGGISDDNQADQINDDYVPLTEFDPMRDIYAIRV